MSSNNQSPKRVLISFLGNINYDTRAVNLCSSLRAEGLFVDTLSFDWVERKQGGEIPVIRLEKSKSSLFFYLKFLFTVCYRLIFNKYDLYIASDIYNLPILALFAEFRGKPLYYDSRELFRYLAGLKNKVNVQWLLAKIEELFIGKCDKIIVTGMMDAEVLMEDYGITLEKFILLRNLPKPVKTIEKIDLRKLYGFPENSLILLYQGVILKGRGLGKLISLLPILDNVCLVILGDGDLRTELENFVSELQMNDKVKFAGTISQSELLSYTASADIGCVLIENISRSYYYALPNKLFEYIAVGVPVLASNLPQMVQIIDEYGVGKYVDPEKQEEIVDTIELLRDPELRKTIKANAKIAHEKLNWDNEYALVKRHFI
ncbi:MAG: glycosyltransferase [Ignavibacteriales bacterium]|nr:glycosyltransferase [Ignavibacteriales bacterium]